MNRGPLFRPDPTLHDIIDRARVGASFVSPRRSFNWLWLMTLFVIGAGIVGVWFRYESEEDHLPPQSDGSISLGAASVAAAKATSTTVYCHTVDDGYLEANQVFGYSSADFVHVSYWTPDGADQKERDVILEGGPWGRYEGVSGYFWVYDGCTYDEVESQARAHQQRRTEQIDDQHAGWGNADFFTRMN